MSLGKQMSATNRQIGWFLCESVTNKQTNHIYHTSMNWLKNSVALRIDCTVRNLPWWSWEHGTKQDSISKHVNRVLATFWNELLQVLLNVEWWMKKISDIFYQHTNFSSFIYVRSYKLWLVTAAFLAPVTSRSSMLQNKFTISVHWMYYIHTLF